MDAHQIIILCSIIGIISLLLGLLLGLDVHRPPSLPISMRQYSILEAFSLQLVYCTIAATLRFRLGGDDKYLNELASILAGVHSHRKCYEEALHELEALYKRGGAKW